MLWLFLPPISLKHFVHSSSSLRHLNPSFVAPCLAEFFGGLAHGGSGFIMGRRRKKARKEDTFYLPEKGV